MGLPSSDDQVLLLHNPRCSKSRATLALLQQRGVDFALRDYLEDPLTEDELRGLCARLGERIGAFVRTGEKQFAASGLDGKSGDEESVAAVAAHPILLERPILIRGNRAAIGRPPERVLSLLR